MGAPLPRRPNVTLRVSHPPYDRPAYVLEPAGLRPVTAVRHRLRPLGLLDG